jgi:hypothetical protein
MTTPEEVPVKRFDASGSEIAVFEFQGQLRDLMVSNFRDSYLATGKYVADAKAISPQGALSMAVAGTSAGAMALSASLSSTLYVATADPSTLMKLGSGVGSAVMGVNGIVAQAPFMPVASALPLVGPVLAMQAISTAVMLKQFEQVDQKLDAIKSTLDQAIARTEATHTGEILTASNIVEEIYRQYDLEGAFSRDMLIRLALAEHDVRGLAQRFRYLVDTHDVAAIDDIEDVQRANYDVHTAMLASFLELRIAYLRVCVDMQENPKSVQSSVERLKRKIEDDADFWQKLLNRSGLLRDFIRDRESSLDDMNWVKRNLPQFAGGRGATAERQLQALRQAYVATLESEKTLMEGFDSLIHSAKQTLKSLQNPSDGPSTSPTLVYWKDETGEQSFYTEKLSLS